MTVVVNFYGGPSAGKSTMAAQLFGIMKAKRMNVEYVPEFAKDLTWKKSLCIDDQLYVLANQHHALYVLRDQVDYIITDSPLLLSIHYAETSLSKFDDNFQRLTLKRGIKRLACDLYNSYTNYNYFVERGDRAYIQQGRSQSEPEAKVIDRSVYELLVKYKIPFETVTSIDDVTTSLLGS